MYFFQLSVLPKRNWRWRGARGGLEQVHCSAKEESDWSCCINNAQATTCLRDFRPWVHTWRAPLEELCLPISKTKPSHWEHRPGSAILQETLPGPRASELVWLRWKSGPCGDQLQTWKDWGKSQLGKFWSAGQHWVYAIPVQNYNQDKWSE